MAEPRSRTEGRQGKLILYYGSEVYSVSDVPSDATVVDVEGVVVLKGEEEINRAVDFIPDKYGSILPDIYTLYNLAKNKFGIDPLKVEYPEVISGYELCAKRRRRELDIVVEGDIPYRLHARLYKHDPVLVRKIPKPKV